MFSIVIYVSDSHLFFLIIYALLHSEFYFFFLYQSPSSSVCLVFDAV